MGIFNSAIFNNAVFNTDETANQTVLLGGGPGKTRSSNSSHYHYHIPSQIYSHEDKISEKQESIINLRVEAQDNLMRQRELIEKQDKQSSRQLAALEREQQKLIVDLQLALIDLQKYDVIKNNNEAILILMMVYPYLNIGGETMH